MWKLLPYFALSIAVVFMLSLFFGQTRVTTQYSWLFVLPSLALIYNWASLSINSTLQQTQLRTLAIALGDSWNTALNTNQNQITLKQRKEVLVLNKPWDGIDNDLEHIEHQSKYLWWQALDNLDALEYRLLSWSNCNPYSAETNSLTQGGDNTSLTFCSILQV